MGLCEYECEVVVNSARKSTGELADYSHTRCWYNVRAGVLLKSWFVVSMVRMSVLSYYRLTECGRKWRDSTGPAQWPWFLMSRARSLNGLSKVRPVLRSDSIMLGMCPGEFFSLEN